MQENSQSSSLQENKNHIRRDRMKDLMQRDPTRGQYTQLPVSKNIWKELYMVFMLGIQRTQWGSDSIFVGGRLAVKDGPYKSCKGTADAMHVAVCLLMKRCVNMRW